MNREPGRLRLVLVVLVLLAFTLITLDYRAGKSGPLGSLRNGVSSVFAPIGTGLSHLFSPVGHFFGDLGHAGRDGARVRTLEQQVAALQSQLRQQGDVAAQRAELRQLLTFSAAQKVKLLPAQVVGYGDASGFDDTLTLDVGSADGIRLDMTIIAGTTQGGGLVGRVVAVSGHNATVATVIDPSVFVGSRLRRTTVGGNVGTQAGSTHGHGLAPLTFTPFDPSVRPVKGDVVETYGDNLAGGGIYPTGIPIGTVTSVAPTAGQTSITANVVPYFDYYGLDVVGVVVQPSATAPAQPVLPTATVTVTVTATPAPPTAPTSPGAPTSPLGGSSVPGTTPTAPTSSRHP